MKLRYIAVTGVSVALIALALVLHQSFGVRAEPVRIAAGTEGSGIHQLGSALAELFNEKVSGVEATVVRSDKLRNSLELLLTNDAEIAIAFSDSEGDGEIRTLVPLYELYLYTIVWEDSGIDDIPALKGRKVGLGPKGSGTDLVSRRLLSHYRFAETDISIHNDGHRELSQLFLKRQLDAVFILGSIESKAVERMLKAPGAKLLSLDDPERIAPVMDGIRSKHPFVVSHIIPKHLFGTKPQEPTGVIGVHALLVASAELPDETARKLTESIFQNKVSLGAKVHRLRDINESFDATRLRFPLHPGAAQYYRRDEPPAILEWADTISLFITLLVLTWSGVLAIAARRRQKRKTLLDDFYREFQSAAFQCDESSSVEELEDARDRLHDLRKRVFDALMAGQIEADSGFVVFHDYLRSELQEIEGILREHRREAGAEAK